MTPRTDIIISVRSTRRYNIDQIFENCVNSVVRFTNEYRFIFVDDNSDSEGATVLSRVASQFPTCVLIRTHRQNWFTRAYNKGLRLVRTPRAVILNADTTVDNGWLQELYDVWDEAEKQSQHRVGLVGSVFSPPESRRWISISKPGFVTGHCWLMSMQAIFEASSVRGQPGWYLDETNINNAHIRSDVEMCYKLNELGYLTIQSHKSPVGHVGGASWGYDLFSVGQIKPQDLAE